MWDDKGGRSELDGREGGRREVEGEGVRQKRLDEVEGREGVIRGRSKRE